MDAGLIAPAPARPLAHVLIGAVDEAAMVVARADDPMAAREEMGQTIRRLLEGSALRWRSGSASMLVHDDGSGTLLIGQPSHAWISGQLARAWGNAEFGPLAPREEVCLAAEQHDLGMAEWDLSPTLNAGTGLPHSFVEMPLDGASGALERRSPAAAAPEPVRGAARLDARHKAVRHAGSFPERPRRRRVDPGLSWRSSDAGRRSSRRRSGRTRTRSRGTASSLWTWDYMSLAVCLGWAPCAVADVPTATEPVSVSMRPAARRNRALSSRGRSGIRRA